MVGDAVTSKGVRLTLATGEALDAAEAVLALGNPAPSEARRERVGAVERDEQDTVGVATLEIARYTRLVGSVLWHEEHELHRFGGELVADPPQDAREEGIAEELAARLRNDDGDRVAAPSDEAASRTVRHVAELANRLLDRLPRRVADAAPFGFLTSAAPRT